MGAWIQTASDLAFDFDEIEANEIRIEDIAHHLAHINRFTGAAGVYNVAQHSVLVSQLVERFAREWALDSKALAMRGLLHDASEAYLGDVSRPLKSKLAEYVAIEHRVEAMIECKFNLVDDPLGLVKKADSALLATEFRDLMGPPPRARKLPERRVPTYRMRRIVPLPPKASKRLFLMRFVELGGQRSDDVETDTI